MSTQWRSIALSDRLARHLLSEADLAERIDEAGLDAVVLGLERLDPLAPEGHQLDPTSLAPILARRIRNTRLLIAATNHREHPWNLARAVASLQNFVPSGSGLVLAARDRTVPDGRPGARAWDVGNLSRPVDIGPEATIDAGVVARKLWDDYPFDAVIADPSSNTYLDLERVRASDHRGVYDVAGPLPVPTRGRPLLSLFVPDGAPVAVPPAFDSVTVPLDLAIEAARGADAFGGRPLIAYVRDPDDLARAAESVRSGGQVLGVQALVTDDHALRTALKALGALG
ncbi:hypothetical protein SAMN04489712_12617 [Thermomonospora echinospora]|uniref:Luciferase-like monooxygenase n=1 Tax=Thermomonospora echinospora TaxID=1992 RepID=A0A1H6DYF9_9ACTN|nr:hypothetical protein [Thermomonospora echinospora]SEG90372.1 hypothetical protein SAMN04489712_12617 [Thermomonospora echinospora]